ncbi:MAG: ATP-binding protein [Holophagales bacterium]|nr:ATP-binding protein [Holophagales bacterium]
MATRRTRRRTEKPKTFLQWVAADSATARKALSAWFGSDTPPRKEVDISEAYRASSRLLGEYVTLDEPHQSDIDKVMRRITAYADDRSRKRPLNIIMRAEPGSGKTHFVKCLATRLRRNQATAVDFNMASLQHAEDLVVPLDAVRNQKVVDRLPLLFLDEFDSDQTKLALLLPLLWDGELHVAHKDLKLGKVVIILAGSSRRISEAMTEGKAMTQGPHSASDKWPDLLSRINGGELQIPALDLVEGARDRRLDKVCLTVALLQERFGALESIPWALLRFVHATQFRYGVRSIAHLIDLRGAFSGTGY